MAFSSTMRPQIKPAQQMRFSTPKRNPFALKSLAGKVSSLIKSPRKTERTETLPEIQAKTTAPATTNREIKESEPKTDPSRKISLQSL